MSLENAAAAAADVPVQTLFNPFRPDFSADPYATYRRLRERTPLFSVPGCLGRDWIVVSFDLARQILGDQRFVVDDLPARIRANAAELHATDSVDVLCTTLSAWLFFIDGSEHAGVRSLLSGAFAKGAVQAFRSHIAASVRSLCAASLARRELDVIADLAQRLPTLVVTRLLGFGDGDTEELAMLSAEAFGIFTQPLTLRRYQAIDRSLRKLHTHLARLLEKDRREPGGALASVLLREQDAGRLSEAQTLAFCSLLLSVGQDTTQNLIGNAVHGLLENPKELQRLCADPTLLPSAVRELARFNSPVQLVVRIASIATELRGCRIEAGERVHVFLGAALRDPAVFANPDVLDIGRPPGSPLPFGAGKHFCLGFHLAQLEAELALEHLLPRLQQLRPAAAPEWFRSVHMRGLRSLVLRLPEHDGSTV